MVSLRRQQLLNGQQQVQIPCARMPCARMPCAHMPCARTCCQHEQCPHTSALPLALASLLRAAQACQIGMVSLRRLLRRQMLQFVQDALPRQVPNNSWRVQRLCRQCPPTPAANSTAAATATTTAAAAAATAAANRAAAAVAGRQDSDLGVVCWLVEESHREAPAAGLLVCRGVSNPVQCAAPEGVGPASHQTA
jgi:hypothetical protein